MKRIHTDTNVGIIGNNVCEMTHFSEWQSIHTNIGIQVNTTAGGEGKYKL